MPCPNRKRSRRRRSESGIDRAKRSTRSLSFFSEIMSQGAGASASGAPVAPNETLYIQNLNESVAIPVMKQTLEALFTTYGPVLSIVAHKNLRMRGQAFVSFQDVATASKAKHEVNGFPLYGKSMRLSFARTKSDSVVAYLGKASGSAEKDLEEHKKARLAQKPITRRRNSTRQRLFERKKAHEQAVARGEAGLLPARRSTSARTKAHQLPDEYVPPNRILFLQQMPDTVTHAQLMGIFGHLANLYQVRTIPGRTDIAFVEFHDIPSSVAARDATNGYVFPTGEHLKVSFARA